MAIIMSRRKEGKKRGRRGRKRMEAWMCVYLEFVF
jgi:hypothetical protein